MNTSEYILSAIFIILLIYVTHNNSKKEGLKGYDGKNIDTENDVENNLDNARKAIRQIKLDLDNLEDQKKIIKTTTPYKKYKNTAEKHSKIIRHWSKVLEEINNP